MGFGRPNRVSNWPYSRRAIGARKCNAAWWSLLCDFYSNGWQDLLLDCMGDAGNQPLIIGHEPLAQIHQCLAMRHGHLKFDDGQKPSPFVEFLFGK